MKKILKFEGSDKVALLLTFVLVVVAANILVKFRNKVSLSGPVELPNTGLSVALPTNKLWKSEKSWNYGNLSQSITCSKIGRDRQPSTVLTFKYNLFEYNLEPKQYLQETYGEFGIVDSGIITAENIDIHWVCIKINQNINPRRDNQYQVISRVIAVADLQDSRQIEINIITKGFTDSIIRLIKAVGPAVRYTPSQEIANGLRLKDEIINSNYQSLLKPSVFYLVNNKNGNPIGFRMEKNQRSKLVDKNSILFESFDMITAQLSYTNKVSVNFVEDLAKFKISGMKELENGNEQFMNEIIFDKPVFKINYISGFYSGYNNNMDAKIETAHTFIPSNLYAVAARYFFKSNSPAAILDMVDVKGKIIPTLIENAEVESDSNAAGVLRFTSLDGSGNIDDVFLDRAGNISKIINQQQGYEIVTADKEQIELLFPMWYELIESYSFEARR